MLASMGIVEPLYPAAILGAGKYSEHTLHVLRGCGVSILDVVLFDDSHKTRSVGALGNTVQGSLEDGVAWIAQRRRSAFIALGSRCVALRYAIFCRLVKVNAQMSSVIHPSSIVSPDARVEANTLIMPGCVISNGVKIGALTTIFAGVTIEHDCVIDDNVTLGPGVTLSGKVQIGAHAFIGAGATIGPEVKIGERVVIGAGAVVVNDIEAGVVAFGVPARKRRLVEIGDDAPTQAALDEALSTTDG